VRMVVSVRASRCCSRRTCGPAIVATRTIASAPPANDLSSYSEVGFGRQTR
jgi:hypothetical protein